MGLSGVSLSSRVPSLATHDAAGAVSGIDDRGVPVGCRVVKALQEILAKIAGYAEDFVSAHITATDRRRS
jgi:hypothetical protein